MKRLHIKWSMVLVGLVICQTAFAQFGPNGYNPNSVRPILESDVMFRTSILRKVNLLEKQNTPFFSVENEISRVIIEGVKDKKLQPYKYDASPRNTGISTPMAADEFLRELRYFDANVGDTFDVKPYQLCILEIKEDLVFDRRRSRIYWDIQAISLMIPQKTTPKSEMGDIPLCNFKFKDLYTYFKETYDKSQEGGAVEDVRAHWYNPENPRRHMSLAEAFELRLFASRITKVSNPKDEEIVQIINNEYVNDPKAPQKVLEMSQKIEYDLMEFEHNVWEF